VTGHRAARVEPDAGNDAALACMTFPGFEPVPEIELPGKRAARLAFFTKERRNAVNDTGSQPRP
jgi:hypothetical protein